MTAPPRVRFDAVGIEVESGLLWLDARRPKPFGVISHAHADHVGRHETILCTPATAAFVRRRSGAGPRFLERPYGEPTRVGDLTVTLLPAGHVLGSAMVLLEGPGGTLLYTGDVRVDGGLTCPPAGPVKADVLVTEATFGRSDHRFPPPDAVRGELVRWARATIEARETPVFLAYALGKAQEVMSALCAARVPVAAHGAVWKLCDVYREHGIRFPGARKLSRGVAGAAVVTPPRFRPRGERLRVAAVTGWGDRALAPGIERAFQLSDHSDFDGLLRLVERVRPSRVHVVHGYAREFALELRARGYEADPAEGHAGPDEDEIPGAFGSPNTP
jgi:Cft2 family RNA processing exonuclease